MKKPDIPENEDARLDALIALNILDTPSEERFDRLTRLAKRTFDVPIAIVSLVDENRQWFKSSIGLGVSETSRDISFCGHAILGDELFIIPDATKDERFADNPLVLGQLNIRFYAGYPLKTINGEKLGTFCIIDNRTRNFSKEDIKTLEDLGAIAEREISIAQLAVNDNLTKIINKRGFIKLAQYSLNVFNQYESPATLIYFYLNNFESIKEEHGCSEGDKILLMYANELKNALRDTDVLARIEDNIFSALLGNVTSKQAQEIIKRLGEATDEYNKNTGNEFDISFSHVVVEYDPHRHHNIEALMAEANAILCERNNLIDKLIYAN